MSPANHGDGEGRANERPALARCVTDPATFASTTWATSALFSPASTLPRPFDDLLDLGAVDELLSRRGLRTPFLRMARDGVVIDPASFTRSGGAGAEIADQVADDAVAALFADGATIVLQGLHRVWPPIIDFAAELGLELGHPVQVNAYVTPPSSRGFSAHYDLHDVFVLQIAGEKRWLVHEPVLEAPLRSQPWTGRRGQVERAARERKPVADVTLRPGDSLYLPRGFLHAAEALGEVAGHLTVGVHVVTRHAILQALLSLTEDDLELRRSLPLGVDVADPGQLAPEVETTLRALTERLGSVEAEEVAERLRSTVWRASRPAPLAPLEQANAMANLPTGLKVKLRPQLRIALREAKSALELVVANRTLDLDGVSADAIRLLLDGAPHDVSQLPGTDPEQALTLARRLLREGVVVPVES